MNNCPNCNDRVMRDDSVAWRCWNCGWYEGWRIDAEIDAEMTAEENRKCFPNFVVDKPSPTC